MPKKNAKGEWEFTDEEQGDIEIAARARVRADEIISERKRKEQRESDCAEGKHKFADGKVCEFCDAPKPKDDAPPKSKKKLW